MCKESLFLFINYQNLEDNIEKVALVTGGSKGIGLFVVLDLLKEGYKVVTCSRNSLTWQQSQEKYPQLRLVDYQECDLSKRESIASLFEHIKKNYNCLELAVNNASPAIKCTGEITEFSDEDINYNLFSDLHSPMLCIKHELSIMGAGARIVNVSSISGLFPFKNIPIYTASKFGLEGLTKSLAVKYASKNIRINSVAPGYTMSPRWEKRLEEASNPEEVKQAVINKIPLLRYGKPQEIANAVLWLLSENSSYVVGHTLVVDGGATLME